MGHVGGSFASDDRKVYIFVSARDVSTKTVTYLEPGVGAQGLSKGASTALELIELVLLENRPVTIGAVLVGIGSGRASENKISFSFFELLDLKMLIRFFFEGVGAGLEDERASSGALPGILRCLP
jgi:hypothetical protein